VIRRQLNQLSSSDWLADDKVLDVDFAELFARLWDGEPNPAEPTGNPKPDNKRTCVHRTQVLTNYCW